MKKKEKRNLKRLLIAMLFIILISCDTNIYDNDVCIVESIYISNNDNYKYNVKIVCDERNVYGIFCLLTDSIYTIEDTINIIKQ